MILGRKLKNHAHFPLVTMLQGGLFDYDGTLAMTMERQHDWFHYWARLNGRNKLTHPEHGSLDDIKSFAKAYNNTLYHNGVQAFYDELDLPCDMNDKTHPVWIAYDAFKMNNPAKLYPGIKEAVLEIWNLGNLNQKDERNHRLRLGINTTNSWASICRELSDNGILHCFDSYISKEILIKYDGAGNAAAITKPSKVSVALSLGVLNTDGGATFHIGDTLSDLRASIDVRHSGRIYKAETLITIGVAWGYEGLEKLKEGVKINGGTEHFRHLVDRPKDLPEVIRQYL